MPGRPPSPANDQPTQVIPIVGSPYPPGAPQPAQAAPRPGGCGCLAPLLVLLVIPVALLAAALLLTPARESLLILGSDARPDEIKQGIVGRTDTLLTLVADRATPKVSMVSVPRDLWVPIAGTGGEERINAAYEIGGPGAAKQTVANVLGIAVDRYAVIGLQGVRDVVDAVGGVEITVEEELYDPAYPTDTYGIVEVRIPAGRQRMDGETALRYARSRHQDSDFGRIARQQRVVAAVRNALLAPTGWPRIPAVFAAAQASIKTDATPLDWIAIAAAFLRDRGEPDRLVLDQTLVEPFTGQGGAALLAPLPGIRPAVARFLGIGPTTVRVEVLNGAGVAGLARTTADRIVARGSGFTFQVAQLGNTDRPQAQTSIQTRPAARRGAEAIAAALGVPSNRVVETGDLAPGVDVRVIAGSDLPK